MMRVITVLLLSLAFTGFVFAQDPTPLPPPAQVETQQSPAATKETVQKRMDELNARFAALQEIAKYLGERIQLMRAEYQDLEKELQKMPKK